MGKTKLSADIAIVGGGPAGGVLALAAADAGFRTVLIETSPPGPARQKDARNYAIVLGSWRLLRTVGLAQPLEAGSTPLHGLEAEDGTGHWLTAPPFVAFGDNDLPDREAGETLGRMVEATALHDAIDSALADRDGLTRLAPDRFDALDSDGQTLHLASGTSVHARLIVASDGAQSAVREAVGIPTLGWEYDQTVVSANIGLDRPHGGIARQLFTPEGPFAILPLSGQRANFAWYMPRAAARALLGMSRDEVEAELNARFAHFAGPMTLDSDPSGFPLSLKIAERLVSGRVALLGDAARRISPIAGQGLNSGLKDVGALMDVIEDARRVGTDWGSPIVLERYERWRRFDSVAVSLAMDGMSRGFASRNLLVKPARTLAMLAAQTVAPLRRALAGQASASQSGLPRRMQAPPAV